MAYSEDLGERVLQVVDSGNEVESKSKTPASIALAES